MVSTLKQRARAIACAATVLILAPAAAMAQPAPVPSPKALDPTTLGPINGNGVRPGGFAAPVQPVDPQYSSPPTAKRVTDVSSINGVWETWMTRGDAAHPPSPAIPRAPLKASYQAEVDALAAKNRAATAAGQPPTTAWSQCLPEAFPSMMRAASFGLQILVTPGQVTMIDELLTQVRYIYLDEPQGRIGDIEPGFFGHSVGHWEGDTLVVDTIAVKTTALFNNTPHSDQQRITERIRLTSPDFLVDDVTIVDPVVLTGPWTFSYVMKRNNAMKLQEYVCEHNREYDNGGAQRLKVSE